MFYDFVCQIKKHGNELNKIDRVYNYKTFKLCILDFDSFSIMKHDGNDNPIWIVIGVHINTEKESMFFANISEHAFNNEFKLLQLDKC